MAELVVRDIEEALIQRLSKRASDHGVSTEEEHRRILQNALSESEDAFPDLKALLVAMPDAGEDADFERIREFPRAVDLS